MSFRNEIVDGNGAITIPAIQSPNYVAGVSGWIIRQDGTSEFNSVTIRGTAQSPNYVPGVSGWSINNNGTVEFNSGTFRGDTFLVGTAPNIIKMSDVNLAATLQFGTLNFPIGTVAPFGPQIFVTETGLPVTGQGVFELVSAVPSGAGQNASAIVLYSSGTLPITNPSEIDVGAEVLKLNINNAGRGLFLLTTMLAQIQGPSALTDLATMWAWPAPLVNSPVPASRIFLDQTGSTVVTLGGGTGTATITLPAAFPNGLVNVMVSNGDGNAFTGTVAISTQTVSTFTVICKTLAGGIPANGTAVRVNWFARGW